VQMNICAVDKLHWPKFPLPCLLAVGQSGAPETLARQSFVESENQHHQYQLIALAPTIGQEGTLPLSGHSTRFWSVTSTHLDLTSINGVSGFPYLEAFRSPIENSADLLPNAEWILR